MGVMKNLIIERRPQQQSPGALISQTLFKTFPKREEELSPLLHHLERTFSSVLGLFVWKKNSKEKDMRRARRETRKKTRKNNKKKKTEKNKKERKRSKGKKRKGRGTRRKRKKH
jgi:hypothetical protein